MVELLPLCASTAFEADAVVHHPKMMELIDLFRKRHSEVVSHVAPIGWSFIGYKGRRTLSILSNQKPLLSKIGLGPLICRRVCSPDQIADPLSIPPIAVRFVSIS
jgi:hypothetical protein